MAYRRRTRSSYRRASPSRARRSYSRPRRARRATRSRATQRIVIQVVGGGTGVPAAPLSIGSKGYRPVRARY